MMTCRAVRRSPATPRAVGSNGIYAGALRDLHSPVAALAELTSAGVRLRAEILSGDGAERIGEERVVADEAEAEALARALLGRASPATRSLFNP